MNAYSCKLEAGEFYHVYNRGVNGQNIFFSAQNYAFFLKRYVDFLHPVVESYAYCLLPNHFHLLVKVRSSEMIAEFYEKQQEKSERKGKKDHSKGLHSVDRLVSKQFGKFFSSYTQAMAKMYGRTGNLLESPFKRLHVDNDAYLRNLIYYIHRNAEHHGLADDFRDYPFSSYHSFISVAQTRLPREEVLKIYDDRTNYLAYHSEKWQFTPIEHLIIEF